MIDIDKLKPIVIEKLMPLQPDKIILFGSYANGKANEESDIDLFLIKKNLSIDKISSYELSARKMVRELIYKYKIGFDILSASSDYIENTKDYFYNVDILRKGKVWYERKVS